MDAATLLKAINDAGRYGLVHLEIYEKPENTPWENIIIEHFAPPIFSKEELTKEAVRIDELSARIILIHLLTKDMAYESEIISFEKASNFANIFCSMFSKQASYFTNSSWNIAKITNANNKFKFESRSWLPLTEATFDSGIIISDINKVGIAWFEDED